MLYNIHVMIAPNTNIGSDADSPNSQENKLSQDLKVDKLSESLERLERITKKGLCGHMCGLFHDEYKLLTEFKNVAGYFAVDDRYTLPLLCNEQEREYKLGCAHHGDDSFEVTPGQVRSLNATARSYLQKAAAQLTLLAPEYLSADEEDALFTEIQSLGMVIARLDVAMGQYSKDPDRVPPIRQKHDAAVMRLFEIAEFLEERLRSAI